MRRLWMLCLLLLAWPTSALAKDDGSPRTLAVQNRVYTQRHEYTVWAGSLPMDAFTKGVTFSGGYTLHFNNLFAWEVASFHYSLPVETRLRDELANLPQPVGPTPFEIVEYFGTSNIVFKPIYGKFAVMNKGLVHQEIFFIAGGGYGRMTITSRPILDVGIGMRLYTGPRVSFRFDAREILLITSDDMENELWIGLGLSLGLGAIEG